MALLYPGVIGTMPFSLDGSGHDDGTNAYFETVPSCSWAQVEAVCEQYKSRYAGLAEISCPYCTVTCSATGILTPINLPDSSFADTGPSPIPYRHSHDYHHGFGDFLSPRGFEFSTTTFLGDYPTETAVDLGFSLQDIEQADTVDPTAQSTQSERRTCQATGHTQPLVVQGMPVSILPHPEGLQHLQQERFPQTHQQQKRQHPQHRRNSKRRRRHPQAELEDTFVEGLRKQNMSWKAIKELFRERFNSDAPEPRLQMRMTRRRKERQARHHHHYQQDKEDSSDVIERMSANRYEF